MASTAAYNLWDNHRYSIANFNFNTLQQLNILSRKQADEILPKINALKQYYVHEQELFYFRLCSCDVTYSSAQ